MRELADDVVLAADGLLAGVVVGVLGAAAVVGGEDVEAAVRVELPGARGDGAVASDARELTGGVVGELLAAGLCDGVGLRAVVGQRGAREGQQVLVVRVGERLLAVGAGGVGEAVEVVVREALCERGGLRRGAGEVAGLGEEAGDVVGVGEVQELRVIATDLLDGDANHFGAGQRARTSSTSSLSGKPSRCFSRMKRTLSCVSCGHTAIKLLVPVVNVGRASNFCATHI